MYLGPLSRYYRLMIKVYTAILIGFLLGGCSAEKSISNISSPVQIVTESPLIDKKVERILLESRSVDEVLQKLSSDIDTKIYTQEFIPIWESSSLQKSYSYCPRILMRNADATFIMSIVGCPTIEDGREDVEILQWNEKQQEFELYSVHYKDSKTVSIGAKNPAECMRCHRGGIAIGAYDAYTWPNSNLRNNAFQLARLAVTSSTGKAVIYESGAYIRSHNIDRYKHLDVLSTAGKYPYMNRSQISTFISRTSAGDFSLEGYNFIEKSSTASFQETTPVNEFNELLAKKNHQRNVAKSKEILGTNYDKYKYFIVAALSDCENFSKMYPENSEFPDPYASEEGNRKLKTIYDRIGMKVLEPRLLETNDFYRALYTIKQLDTVRKIYYGFLSLGLDEGVKDLNFNPIKFTFHPAWGSANMIGAYLADEDFSDLRSIGEVDTVTYLRIRSGIPYFDSEIGNKWQNVKQLFDHSTSSSINPDQFGEAYDKLYHEDANFIKYCESIESKYREKY